MASSLVRSINEGKIRNLRNIMYDLNNVYSQRVDVSMRPVHLHFGMTLGLILTNKSSLN